MSADEAMSYTRKGESLIAYTGQGISSEDMTWRMKREVRESHTPGPWERKMLMLQTEAAEQPGK